MSEHAAPDELTATWVVEIAAPPHRVWDAVVTPGVGADPAVTAVSFVAPGTGPGVGAVWMEITTLGNGRAVATGMQVVLWEPAHRVLLRGATVESLQARVLVHLLPHGPGTRLTLQHVLEPTAGTTPTAFARKIWLADRDPYLRRLKAWCEGPATGSGPRVTLKPPRVQPPA